MRPLGMHMAMRKASGWTNPYVSDTLIAGWDCQWNAGGGVYDPNATVWKDLSGNGFDLTAADGMDFVTWESAGALNTINTGMIALGNTNIISRETTIEVLTDGATDRNGSAIIAINRTGSYAAQLLGYRTASSLFDVYAGGGGRQIPLVNTRGVMRFTFVCRAQEPNITIDAYRDGTLISSGSVTTTHLYTGNKIEVYKTTDSSFGGMLPRHTQRIFVHGRALTDEEIAHNYAIDQARFGIA